MENILKKIDAEKAKEAFYGRYYGQRVEYIPEFIVSAADPIPKETALFKVKCTKVLMSKLLLRSVNSMTLEEAIEAVYLTRGRGRIRNVEIINTNLYGAIRYTFQYFTSSRRRTDDVFYWKLKPEVLDFLRSRGIYVPSETDDKDWFTLV